MGNATELEDLYLKNNLVDHAYSQYQILCIDVIFWRAFWFRVLKYLLAKELHLILP